MKLNIFNKTYHYIGLHLNMHALKALQFEQHRSGTQVRAYTNAPTPKGLIVNDAITDRIALAKFIEYSIAKPQYGNFTTHRVVVSIPESKSFIRVIPMPALSDQQIDNAILFEAEAYIPLPMDQVYFDWQVIERKADTMQVLLIASPKEYVDSYMSVIEKAGLQLCGIEVEAQSVVRALVPATVTEPVLIADMDANKTALVMVENGTLQFTSSVPLAGATFTDRLAKALSILPAKAEEVKRKYGLSNTVEYPNLKLQLLPAVEDLAAEIRNILKFHYDHSDVHIGKLLLTGGGAKLQHIVEALQPMLAQYEPLQITVSDPLEHINRLVHSPLSSYEALSFTTTIGLAMWELE